MDSKIIYDQLNTTVRISTMEFHFSLAGWMEKRLPQCINLQKILKASVLTIQNICLRFLLLMFLVLSGSPRNLRIIHLLVVCPAMSQEVSKKKEINFIYTSLNNEQEYLMNLYTLPLDSFSAWWFFEKILWKIIKKNVDFCFATESKIPSYSQTLLQEKRKY